jgi:hypothetical protein
MKRKTLNKSFDNVTNLKYLEVPLKNQNCMHEEIRSKIKMENTCYHLLQVLPLQTSTPRYATAHNKPPGYIHYG